VQKATLILRALLSLFGIALLVLGALFWANRVLTLIPLHMLLGVLFVICLWGLVVLGFYARLRVPLPLVVLVWSFIVPALGVEQVRLLAGPHRRLIQSLHLLVGLIALGLGHGLARRIAATRRPAARGSAAST
jgi:hypothetical protein